MSPEDQKKSLLARRVEFIHNALVVNVPVKRIPEGTFVRDILPYYCGEATSPDLPVLVAAAAGGPFHEFDVVNDQGEVLFRAPALLERSMFDFKEFGKGLSAESIFQTAGMLNNRSPRQAAAFIQEQLTGRGLSKNAGEIYRRLIERRNDILRRYGKEIPGDKTTGSTNHSSDKDPGIDYEESVLL